MEPTRFIMVSELSEDGNWVWDGSKWIPTNHQKQNHTTSPNQSRGFSSIKESNKNFNSEEIQLQKKPMGENLEDESLQEKPYEITGMPRILLQVCFLGWFSGSVWLFLEDHDMFLIILISPILLFVILGSAYVFWNMFVIDRSWIPDAINEINDSNHRKSSNTEENYNPQNSSNTEENYNHQNSSNTEEIQVVNSIPRRKIGIGKIFSFLFRLAGFFVGVTIGMTQLQKGNLGGAMRSFTAGISNPQGLTDDAPTDSNPLGTSTYSCQLPSCNYRFSNVLDGRMIDAALKHCPNCGSSVKRDLYGSAIPSVSNPGDMGRVSYQCMLLSCSYSVGPVARGTDVGRCMNCGGAMKKV